MGKQKVALVLSMGGARGIAHIGVIEELLRHNYEITSIAGSSMGAMVGAMYASGKLEECKDVGTGRPHIKSGRTGERRSLHQRVKGDNPRYEHRGLTDSLCCHGHQYCL